MSHHSSEPNKALSEAMNQLFGEYPDGRLNPDDAGAVAFAIGVEEGRVVLRFPKPVVWLGMTGDEALGLAQVLMQHARRAGITAPVVLRLGDPL